MDGSGFDALTRAVSGLRSRRGLAQLLLGAALGGAPALAGLDEADAKRGKAHKRRKRRDPHRRERQPRQSDGAQADKKGKKKPCPPCKKRKQGKCKGKLPDGAACPGGSCRAGSCVATTSPPVCTPSCGGRVCGGDDGCGKSCGTCTDGLTCQNGQCVLTCESGLTDCSGNCIDLQTDLANCGECEHPCPAPSHASATCANSACGFTCDAGFHTCGDECVSNNDIDNCGTACTPCPASSCSPATCNGMACGRAPIAGCCETDGDCGDDNACTTDTCGEDHTCQHISVICTSDNPCQDPGCHIDLGCITVDHCQADKVCIADGTQAHCCPQTRPLWDGTDCAECTPSDLTHCGTPSNTVVTCNTQGTCDYACEAGWFYCGPTRGCETTSPPDPPMCGACDHFCRPGEECAEGNCRCGDGDACSGEQHCCDGVCRETNTGDHCGACGRSCAQDEVCAAGECIDCDGSCLDCDVCHSGCAYSTIEAAKNNAEPGATITIAPGIYDQIEISIGENLTLRRCGSKGEVKLRQGGDFVGSIINRAAEATLIDLVITQHPQSDYGSGVTNFGGLTLIDCKVTGIMGPPHVVGVGIFNLGVLTVTGGEVTEITSIGPGIYNIGTATITGCLVSRNTHESGSAGGVENGYDSSLLTLVDCVVSDNTGFGIANHGTASLTGTTVSRNDGRGIANWAWTTLTDCTVSDNTGLEDGGGIFNIGGTVTLLGNNTITNNTPRNCAGLPIEGCTD